MKLIAGIIGILTLGTGAFFGWKNWPQQEQAGKPAERQTTAIVEARDINFAVNAAGDIGPAEQVSVRPEVNGLIAELPLDIGDNVAKGALLCRLDDRDLQIERSQRQTEIEGARLSLAKGARTFTRNKELFTANLVSQEIYEDAKTEFDLAANALEKADKALRLLEDRISKTKILAPFDCTVLTRPVSTGQALSGAGGFNAGTEIMTIANLSDMIINAHVNQVDVTRLKNGQAVGIQVESVPGLKMEGVIERIAPQAVIKSGIKGFAARVAIKNIDPRIRPGMTALLTIPVASADNVLSVPLAAVYTEKGQRFVFVKTGEKFERRPVLIGISDYSFAEVQSGLTAGEVVSIEQVVDSTLGVSPGRPAKPRRSAGERAAPGGATRGAQSSPPKPVGS